MEFISLLDPTMSVTIALFYMFVTLFMFLSYNPKPKKIIGNIRSFLLQSIQLNDDVSGAPSGGSVNATATAADAPTQPKTALPSVWDIPGPVRLPLIGTKWLYFVGRFQHSKQHEAFMDLHRQYGNIVLEVDTIPIVHLFDRTDMERVLRHPSRFPFRPPTEILEHYRRQRPERFGETSLVNAQGEKWQELRMKLTSGITSRKILLGLIPTLNEICDDFVQLIRRQRDADGHVRNFHSIVNSVGLEIMCCLVLGRRMGYLTADKTNEKFLKLAEAVKESFICISESYFGIKMWRYMRTPLYRRFGKCEEVIYNTIAEIVYEALSEEQMNCPDDDVKHIFMSILQTEGLQTNEKISGIIDLITSGIETLANSLSFLLHNLSQSTKHQEMVANEFGSCTQTVTNDDLLAATFSKACMQESFRLSPTTPCLARFLEQDFELSGYLVPAGSLVLCHTRIASLNEENFRQADRFKPERWLEQRDENQNIVKQQEPGASMVLPFGIGRRVCPGQKIVEIELTLLLAKIFQNFEIDYRSPLDVQFQFLLAPKTPIDIVFRDRN